MIQFSINISLFAEDKGDKTEKATPRKKREARKKGQVLQSRELTSSIVLLSVFFVLRLSGGFMWDEMQQFTRHLFSNYFLLDGMFEKTTLNKIYIESAIAAFKMLLPVFAAAIIVGVLTSCIQVGFVLTKETIGFKFNRLNPINGMKRIFSIKGLVELVKALLKILIIGYIAYNYLNSQTLGVLQTMSGNISSITRYIAEVTIGVATRVCIALIIMGLFDYLYQWWDYEKNLKMSKHEVKEEHKQTEGNPEIKQRIKQKQRQISMNRMLHDVPEADVVITNPTHYAVAVKYDSQKSQAPVVTAKGLDYVALRIRDIAGKSGVQTVENRMLARTLYDSVDIGQAIPEDLYQAVAEVLAYVYRLKEKYN